jgi:hypothetical protein
MEAGAPTVRSILPAQPGRWLLTRVIFYVLVGLIAVGGFFICAPLFGEEAPEASYILAVGLLCATGTLVGLLAVFTRKLDWVPAQVRGASSSSPSARRLFEILARVRELEMQMAFQRQTLELVTSKAAMTQAIGEALRGGGWTMDEQELANIVSRAMDEMRKITEQTPQQAVDHPNPVDPRLP